MTESAQETVRIWLWTRDEWSDSLLRIPNAKSVEAELSGVLADGAEVYIITDKLHRLGRAAGKCPDHFQQVIIGTQAWMTEVEAQAAGRRDTEAATLAAEWIAAKYRAEMDRTDGW